MEGSAFATIDNYFGSLFFMGSFFLEKSFSQWQIEMSGNRPCNVTMLGNAFDANNDHYFSVTHGPGVRETGHLELIANLAGNFSDAATNGQNRPPLPDQILDPSMWLVREAFDDFRRLGYADLQHNHPELFEAQAA